MIKKQRSTVLEIPKLETKPVVDETLLDLDQIVSCLALCLKTFVKSNSKLLPQLVQLVPKKEPGIDFDSNGLLSLPSQEEYQLMLRFVFLDILSIDVKKELYRYMLDHLKELLQKYSETTYAEIAQFDNLVIPGKQKLSLEQPIWMLLILYIFESPTPLSEALVSQQEITSVSIVGQYQNKKLSQTKLRLCGHQGDKTIFIGNTNDLDSSSSVKLSFEKGLDVQEPYSIRWSYLGKNPSQVKAFTYLEVKPDLTNPIFTKKCGQDTISSEIDTISKVVKRKVKLKQLGIKSDGSIIYTKEIGSLNVDYQQLIVLNYRDLPVDNTFFKANRKDKSGSVEGSKQDKIIWVLVLSQYIRFSHRYHYQTSGAKKVPASSYYYLRPYERLIDQALRN